MDLFLVIFFLSWMFVNVFIYYWFYLYRKGEVVRVLSNIVYVWLAVNICIVALIIFVVLFLPVEVYGRLFFNRFLDEHYRSVF